MANANRDENSVPTLLAVSSVDGVTPVTVYADPTTHRLLTDSAAGTGTVTDVSVVTANGVSGSVATSTTTPAITLTLGAITPTTVNGITLSGTGTPTLAVTGTSTISGANTGDNSANSSCLALTGGTMTGAIIQAPTSAVTLYDMQLETEWTGGTLINADYASSVTQLANIYGIILDFNTNVVGNATKNLTGYQIKTPAFTQASSNTTTYIGYDLATAGALIQQTNPGTLNWKGINIQCPNITQSAGTVNSYGIYVNGGTVTSGTQYSLFVDSGNVRLDGKLGDTTNRVLEGWFTDLTVTNDINGSITGNAATVTTNANLTGVVTSSGNATAIASGAIKANMLQTTAADLGAADVTINLGNTNGAYVTNLTTDGTITASVNFTGPLNGTLGATTPTTIVATTITANTGIVPDANDGAYLGQAGTAFSDLFLAEGGVINWDSSDATLTQTGNIVALAGADFELNATNLNLGTGTGDKASVVLNSSALADESWSGTIISAVAGATLAVGDVCYLKTADGQWYLNDGILDGTDAGFKLKLGICVLAANDNDATKILLDGLIASAAFPAFTIGAPVYLDDTAGDLVVAQPTTTNFAIRIVGYAVTATVLHFSPDNTYIVHV